MTATPDGPQCINAPTGGVPGKRWDGRTGQPCAGPVESRPSLSGTGTVDLCGRHAADQWKWRADIVRRKATSGQPTQRSIR